MTAVVKAVKAGSEQVVAASLRMLLMCRIRSSRPPWRHMGIARCEPVPKTLYLALLKAEQDHGGLAAAALKTCFSNLNCEEKI